MSAMRIYQRMLYIGLGGTGLKIGSQLEKALRSELCGPSGKALVDEGFPRPLEPFQLPACLQFVYFDFDESARADAKRASSERLSESIAELNSQAVGNLTPTQGSYQKVAQSLRIDAIRAVEKWLPPKEREPQVSPLSKGAGEFPTAGRAALFEAFRRDGGISTVEKPLADAIARLNGNEGDLLALAGDTALKGFDIFVGFSVAGGTGAGTFYDVIRILADVCERNIRGADYTIFPLVVMPSAFADEYPLKQRPHMLNGGQALRELFHLVDNKNTGNDKDNPEMVYPGDTASEMTIYVPTPTAFLFSRPDTVSLEDMHRSIVSFVISNIGTVIAEGDGTTANARPMMASLMDEAKTTNVDAPDGIGQHPAATALAAELRIPIEEIAEVLANRLLAQATAQLDQPQPHEDNGALFDRFAGASGLDVLIARSPTAPLPTANRQGAKEISAYLDERNRAAQKQLRDFHVALQPQVARLATEFDYLAGLQALLGEVDIFHALRVALGDPQSEDEVVKGGIHGFIYRRGEEMPQNKSGFADVPPQPPPLKNKGGGLLKLGLNDPRVVAALNAQNQWYAWKIQLDWYESWRRQRDNWQPQARKMKERFSSIHSQFLQQKAGEPEEFRTACQLLYRKRAGVVYFLPEGGRAKDLDRFYQYELLPRLGTDLHLGATAEPGKIVSKLLSEHWAEAFERTKSGSPGAAVEYTLSIIRQAVREALSTEEGEPLMPPVQKLLRAAAYASSEGSEAAGGVAQPLRDRFVSSLSSLIPDDFRPPGIGVLGIDVFYPSNQKDAQIEDFITRTCLSSLAGQPRFHALGGIDFVSVVLRRISQHVTSIGEYRHLMALRAEALTKPKPTDQLPWRQRLGYDPTWIVLRKSVNEDGSLRAERDERVKILERVLNVLHDGAVVVKAGSPENPARVDISQPDNPDAGPITLELRPLRGNVSSWADIISAYERYILRADEHGLARCEKLLEYDRPQTQEPSDLYRMFMSLRQRERDVSLALRDQLTAQGVTHQGQPLEYEFWHEILPAAMSMVPVAGRSHGQITEAIEDGEAE